MAGPYFPQDKGSFWFWNMILFNDKAFKALPEVLNLLQLSLFYAMRDE